MCCRRPDAVRPAALKAPPGTIPQKYRLSFGYLAGATPHVGKENAMLRWALIFLVISIIAGFFGFSGVSAATARIAKILFVIALVLLVVTLVMALIAGQAVF